MKLRRKPRKSDEELGYFAEMIVRAIVDDWGISRVDIREVNELPYMDALEVWTWNHRRIRITHLDLMLKVDASARRRRLGWTPIV